MTNPSLTSVSPVFKIQRDDGKGPAELAANRFLYAVSLGATTKMVPGGDYYLGKDGKPYYPKDKKKPKPIPVARYFFYISKQPLADADIKKLDRGDCHEPVTLKKKPKQEVVLTSSVPDYVYIMGKDKPGTPAAKQFYASAEKHFLWERRFPVNWITKPEDAEKLSLEDILYEISSLQKPYNNIHIVSHANQHGRLGFPIEVGDKKNISYYSLRKKQKDGTLTDVSKKLDAKNTVIIRGCNIGQNVGMLNLIKKAMGGKCTVYAPTHKQHYLWEDDGTKKKSSEFYHTYWRQYKGIVKKTAAQLQADFREKYPDLQSNLWNKYVKKRNRKVLRLPTNWLEVRRHPPDLDPKKCLAFVEKYWYDYFKKYKSKPNRFIKREGPVDEKDDSGKIIKVYVYHFEGEYFHPQKKEWIKGSFSVSWEVHPKDEELIIKEKAEHPHPELYEWSVSRKPITKGRFLRIRPKAVLTLYQIRMPIIDAKGKYLQAELTNSKYWGKSN